MTPIQQQQAAKEFAAHWEGKGYEKGESQIFWTTLLNQVFGIEHPETFIIYEHQVKLDHTSFIDGFIPTTKVMIEQKSLGKNLGEGIKQSDGSVLNPFQQAKRYAAELPYSQRPRWIVTCNFAEFWVYDMEQPNGEPQKILLKDLEKEYYRLQFLVDEGNEHLKREMEVSVKAGNLVGIIYDKLLEQYGADDPETLRSLNILCVRLVFCLYAEDAGLFNSRTAFHDYLKAYPAQKLRRALVDLFAVLDTPLAERDKYLEDDLAAFPYVNGGLFSDKTIEIPQFTDELKQLLLEDASADFDWSEISPTIFGAVFESTLNPETRRSGGMHYTSIENIHKVIDPLFLDELKAEFEKILDMKQAAPRKQALAAFQDKLASLTFFDPACGSGNFLTETFLSLRRLENKVIQAMFGGENVLTFDILIKVNISQFYGIEINDFACTVAKTALWIAESQTLKETSAIAGRPIDFLPLKTNAYIHEGNALRIDWSEVIAPEKLHYIMGNPPFVGARMKSAEQANDVLNVFGSKWKNSGNLDYVCCWYKKAADMMKTNSFIKAAFVSTNSITQGEQVAILWKPLFEEYGIHFDFAYRTFRWDSEADIKAHVHCVIIGFSSYNASYESKKKIYLSDNQVISASNINGYLVDAPDVWIESRNKPLCNAPEIGIGNKPIDGGNYLFSKEEMLEFIEKEPKSAAYFHPFYGAYEFINQKPRYCLYLGNCSPAELRSMPLSYERVMNVREYRLQSPSAGTRKIADTPTHFHVENMPKGSYIVIPQVSSQRRRYIPMGYMDDGVLCSDKVRIMSEGQLYHFGILESNVHMAWMRTICCRLKSDYSYTINDVYNNFPWCQSTEEQKARIELTAQAILDARAKYPDSSLADLYDEVTMPPELRRAHQENDRAVMAAYGFSTKMTESECVAELFRLYKELTTKSN
ncbi:MAG: class I SAM-dependent DNA methyltransferase [Paludibacteraceae bacterium]|nr:class I SAM-dependent DNA methyltransferase [Paludibacteraceae bacterium]